MIKHDCYTRGNCNAVSVIAAISLLLLCVIRGEAQEIHASKELDKIIQNVEKNILLKAENDKQMIQRILKLFYESSSNKQNWGATLANLNIIVPANIFEDLTADASAKLNKEVGSADVKLNSILLLQIYDQTQAAARFFAVEAANIELNDTDNKTTKLLGISMKRTVIAWALAHEVAHHMHDDVKSHAKNRAEARERELSADKTAFEILNKTGYSLYLLYQYLKYKTSLDQVKQLTGKFKSELESAHPSWQTRTNALKEYVESHPPVENPWIIYSVLDHIVNLGGLVRITYILPQNPIGHVGVMASNGTLTVVGVEQDGAGGKNIYIRDQDLIYIQKIVDVNRHVSQVEIKLANARAKRITAFRDSFEGDAAYDQSNLIKDTLGFDQIDQIKLLIDTLSPDFNKRERAKALIVERATVSNDRILDYYAGRVNPNELQSMMQDDKLFYDGKLKELLGTAAYSQMQLKIDENLRDIVRRYKQNP